MVWDIYISRLYIYNIYIYYIYNIDIYIILNDYHIKFNYHSSCYSYKLFFSFSYDENFGRERERKKEEDKERESLRSTVLETFKYAIEY